MADKSVIDTIIAEAGGGGDKGITAASWAIVQRAAARGQTVEQVVKSGFDGYSNPGSGSRRDQQDPKMRARVERILSGVQDGSIPNPVPGADHFLSGKANPGWSKNMKLVATIDGQRYYASGAVPKSAQGSVKASSPKTALAAIEQVAPATAKDLPSARSAYADSLPELPRARPVTSAPASTDAPPAPRRSVTDEIIHNSTTPQAADPALQAALTRTADAKAGRVAPAYNAVTPDQKSALISSPKPTLQAALDRLAASRAAKLAEAPAQAAHRAPAAALQAQAQPAPRVTAEGLNVRPVTTVKVNPSTGMPEASAPVVEKPAVRVAGVSDVGYPYSFKAVQEKMHPRGTRSLEPTPEAPAKPVAKSATNALSFTPANDTRAALGKGYNALTSSQHDAISAVPEERLYPSALQPADKVFGGIDSVRVASIEDIVGNGVDANGKRVATKAVEKTPLPRSRPASLGVASANALQPSPKVPPAPNRTVAPARVTVAAPTWLAKTMPKAAPIEVPVNGGTPTGSGRVYSTAIERIYDRGASGRSGAEYSSIAS